MNLKDFALAYEDKLKENQAHVALNIVSNNHDEVATATLRGMWHGLKAARELLDEQVKLLTIPAADQAAEPEQEAMY